MPVYPANALILDVSCNDGGSLVHFLRTGFAPEHLYGVDIIENRVRDARKRFPYSHVTLGDAAEMPYDDGTFDIVYESTMFAQLTGEAVASKIPAEMLRVARDRGFLLLSDWRSSKPGNRNYRALSKRRIRSLFQVGRKTVVLASYPGAIIPPVGRPLSKHTGALYFLLRSVFPFLAGHRVTVLQKREP